MNGIKMSDCKFYVDKEARTIVCVIPDVISKGDRNYYTCDMVKDFIEDNFRFNDIDLYEACQFWAYDKRFSDAIKMPRSFIGKAVCAEEDEWDEDLGKLIAYSRAKEKCYKSFFKRANLFVRTLDGRLGDAIQSFNNFGLALENNRDGINQKIDEKLGLTE